MPTPHRPASRLRRAGTTAVAFTLTAALAVPAIAQPLEPTDVVAIVEGTAGLEVRTFTAPTPAAAERLLAELRATPEVLAADLDREARPLTADEDELPDDEAGDDEGGEGDAGDEEGEDSDDGDGGEDGEEGDDGEEDGDTDGDAGDEDGDDEDDPRTPITVTDPYASDQWALDMLRATEVWEQIAGDTGNPLKAADGITVAVIDDGVAATHPDFTPGTVLEGYNAILRAPGGAPMGTSDSSHGTHVAGVIAAAVNNDEGIAGLAPGVRILPVTVFDADGKGDASTVIEGILWAAQRAEDKPDIINLSVVLEGAGAGAGASTTLEAAIRAANDAGIYVIAAAGNGARDCRAGEPASSQCGNKVLYPAALPLVDSVAAVDADGARAAFSQSNSYVDLAAPGACVLSTVNPTDLDADDHPDCDPDVTGPYAAWNGTSMAAPHVAAAAALTKSHWAGQDVTLSPHALSHHLRTTAGAARTAELGHGIVDPYAAVTTTPVTEADDPTAPTVTVPEGGITVAAQDVADGVGYAYVNYIDQVTATAAPGTELASGPDCARPSGSVFLAGEERVACTAVSTAGAVGYAEFTVTVTGPGASTPAPDSARPADGTGDTDGRAGAGESVAVPRVVHAGGDVHPHHVELPASRWQTLRARLHAAISR